MVRNDPSVNFDWGYGSPAPNIPVDYFSVRWTRSFNFDAGMYRFTARADDGVRVWLDSTLIIDEWHAATPNTYLKDINVPAGQHVVRVEYYEGVGTAFINFNFDRVTSFPDWKGDYYNNQFLSGSPTFTRNDVAVSFDWSTTAPAPGVPNRNFSVRWTRTVEFTPGSYRFTLRVNGGANLFIDGNLIISQWNNNINGTFTADYTLSSGTHTFEIDYYNISGSAYIWFTYQPLTGSSSDWSGNYFANDHWSGIPTMVRFDPNINFDWGTGSPAPLLPVDRFSVRWTRVLNLAAGLYQIDVTVDDGVRVYVDNNIVMDHVQESAVVNYTTQVQADAGQSRIPRGVCGVRRAGCHEVQSDAGECLCHAHAGAADGHVHADADQHAVCAAHQHVHAAAAGHAHDSAAAGDQLVHSPAAASAGGIGMCHIDVVHQQRDFVDRVGGERADLADQPAGERTGHPLPDHAGHPGLYADRHLQPLLWADQRHADRARPLRRPRPHSHPHLRQRCLFSRCRAWLLYRHRALDPASSARFISLIGLRTTELCAGETLLPVHALPVARLHTIRIDHGGALGGGPFKRALHLLILSIVGVHAVAALRIEAHLQDHAAFPRRIELAADDADREVQRPGGDGRPGGSRRGQGRGGSWRGAGPERGGEGRRLARRDRFRAGHDGRQRRFRGGGCSDRLFAAGRSRRGGTGQRTGQQRDR